MRNQTTCPPQICDPGSATAKEGKMALPSDLESPPCSVIDKIVIIFHDGSTFQANDDQPTIWAEKGTNVMRPKLKGSGIMISNFIEEKGGYLALMQEQYDLVNDPSTKMYARQLLEYGLE